MISYHQQLFAFNRSQPYFDALNPYFKGCSTFIFTYVKSGIFVHRMVGTKKHAYIHSNKILRVEEGVTTKWYRRQDIEIKLNILLKMCH